MERERALRNWEASYRAAAQADGNASLTDHLKQLEIDADSEMLLEGTIAFVFACASFAAIDGRQVSSFLARQQYDLRNALGAIYTVTFDVYGLAFARLLTDERVAREIDFADLYGSPWEDYQRVGYGRILAARIDGQALTLAEIEQVDDEVTKDLRFDYAEEELAIWSDPDTCEGCLIVAVQDHLSSFEDQVGGAI